jgi:poly(hydroxyalkanoate) depolymerase family esterase
MNASSKINLAKATRLTREGRLEEAMMVLRGRFFPDTSPKSDVDPSPRPEGGRSILLDMTPPSAQSGGAWTASPFGAAKLTERAGSTDLPRFHEALRGFLDRPMGQLGLGSGLDGLATPAARQAVPLPEGAKFGEHIFTNEFGSRTYKLYVPSSYNGESLPLVVMLHGCTQSPDDFAAGTRMNEVAEEHMFLVAYPAQPQSANISKCWNWFSVGDQKRDRGEPSLIAGITRQVMADFSVEIGRVYIAGLSAGGAAAAIMGATYPDLYSAIGVHSGLACGAANDIPSAFAAMRKGGKGSPTRHGDTGSVVPTIVFHGDRDTTVNPVNGDQVIAQAKAAAELGTSISRGKASSGMAYTRTVQTDQSGQPILEQWVLHGAGHAWSGGSSAGSYTDPRGPDATREMLRFFLQYPTAATAT